MEKILYLCVFFLMLAGCASTSVPEFKNNGRRPIDLGNKTSTSCAYYVLGFIFGPFGNLSLPQTAAQADINEITYYDISRSNYVLFAKKCLSVYGR